VVLVTEGEQNMEVQAVGSLRAKAKRPRLKLMHLGKLEILTADGEACERDDDPTTCRRSMTFMVRQGARFNPMRIVARNGECLGPAVIYVARQQTVPLPSGWKRKLEMNSTMETQEARFVVTEQVVVSDYDPTRPGVPPRPVRRADAEIVYWPGKGAKLIASDASLWSRILDQIAKEPEQ